MAFWDSPLGGCFCVRELAPPSSRTSPPTWCGTWLASLSQEAKTSIALDQSGATGDNGVPSWSPAMLSVSNSRDRASRRDFFRIGSLALGGLSLSHLLATQSLAKGASLRPVTGKSVIFLFMHGGPSQIETFDPKMSAPAENRSVTGEIDTSLTGVTY